jgi:hypothetical protein
MEMKDWAWNPTQTAVNRITRIFFSDYIDLISFIELLKIKNKIAK